VTKKEAIEMKQINGDLIKLSLEGNFDVIIHGCNCFCRMGRGIALQIKEIFPEAFNADKKYSYPGDMNKLGNYSYSIKQLESSDTRLFKSLDELNQIKNLIIINAYTQYGHNPIDKPLDYEALTLCLRKINNKFAGKTIGLPLIGSGLAGGNWVIIEEIIKTELKDMDVTIVHYKP